MESGVIPFGSDAGGLEGPTPWTDDLYIIFMNIYSHVHSRACILADEYRCNSVPFPMQRIGKARAQIRRV